MAKRERVAPATGLAARLERAAKSGRMPTPVIEDESPRERTRREREERMAKFRSAAPVRPEEDGSIDGEGPGDDVIVTASEEDEWTGELPPLDPADEAAALANSLSSRAVTEEDVDRFWDWIRSDEDKGLAFLGFVPKTSAELRAACKRFLPDFYTLEDATNETGEHVGFAAFQLLTASHAQTHLYLAPHARGRARQLVPQLLELAVGRYTGYTFVVSTKDPFMARLLKMCGFEPGFMLTWTPPKAEAKE